MFSTPPRSKGLQNVNYASHHTLIDCLKPQKLTYNLELPYKRDSHKVCTVIEDILTPEECNNIILRSEEVGYHQALVNVGVGEIHDPEYRNSSRCIIDDVKFAKEIFERMQRYIPLELTDDNFASWKAVGLNERMRILRYTKGNFFSHHFDGSYKRNNDERSFYTVMIYLNAGGGNDYTGGNTNFLHPVYHSRKTEFAPKLGSCLIFDHNLLHEGAKLLSGTKYAIRTDVMFEKK